MSTTEIIKNLEEKNYEALDRIVAENLLAKAVSKLDEMKAAMGKSYFTPKEDAAE
jgi:hypothetical protein